MALVVGMVASSCADTQPTSPVATELETGLLTQLAETKSISRFLEHDEVRLALDCQRMKGWGDVPEPPTRVPTISAEQSLKLLTLEGSSAGQDAIDPVPDYWGEVNELVSGRSAQFHEALFGGDDESWNEYKLAGQVLGVSSDGCMGTARSQMFGSTRNYLLVTYLPQVAEVEASAGATSLRDYERNLAAWMAQHRSLVDETHGHARDACQRERKFGCMSDHVLIGGLP